MGGGAPPEGGADLAPPDGAEVAEPPIDERVGLVDPGPPAGTDVGVEALGAGPPGFVEVLQEFRASRQGLAALVARLQALAAHISDMENDQGKQQAQLQQPLPIDGLSVGGVVAGGQLLLGGAGAMGAQATLCSPRTRPAGHRECGRLRPTLSRRRLLGVWRRTKIF